MGGVCEVQREELLAMAALMSHWKIHTMSAAVPLLVHIRTNSPLTRLSLPHQHVSYMGVVLFFFQINEVNTLHPMETSPGYIRAAFSTVTHSKRLTSQSGLLTQKDTFLT